MPPPSSSSSSSSSGTWQIPRPLQRLFDTFPLVTYDRPADLPVRARHAISPSLPTLYIFTTPDDALVGAPSFNPGCLKWQTYLRLHSLDHLTLPSTNHASPTGSLPFLLPPISTPSSGSPALNPSSAPIPASGFPAYIARHKKSGTTTPSKTTPHPPSISREQTTTTTPKEDLKAKIREELILSLLPPLRAAFLLTLYLLPLSTPLLDKLYLSPATSSPVLQASLRSSLRRAAEREVLNSLSCSSGAGSIAGGRPTVDMRRVLDEARGAMEGLAGFLAEEGEGADGDGPWFSGGSEPGEVDCGVFGFTFLMMRLFSSFSGEEGEEGGEGEKEALGGMVRAAGKGELEGHVRRMAGRVEWGGYL